MHLDLSELSALTTVAYLAGRGKREMAVELADDLASPPARAVANVLIGAPNDDDQARDVAESLRTLVAKRLHPSAD